MKTKNEELRSLAGLFLKLGFTAFGGPAAHIAMMEREVVDKRQWLTHEQFLDLLSATNLIPGPNSTEMAIHIGQERAGFKGLLVAGICFIMPAVLITGTLAWLYGLFGNLPEMNRFIYGIKPAIIAVVLGAVYPLARKSFKNITLGVIGIAVLVLSLLGVHELALMFGAGVLYVLVRYLNRTSLHGISLPVWVQPALLLNISNTSLFLKFLKIGSVLYGSGYVLFAFLDSELVHTGILSRKALMDAIAVGQFTPGPVFSAVTFVGWQINGLPGAALATLGVFLPSFVFVALLNPLIPAIRRSALFSAFLDAVNAASIALIAGVCYVMGKDSLVDWRSILIAVLSAVIVFSFRKLNSAYIVLGGAAAGYVLS